MTDTNTPSIKRARSDRALLARMAGQISAGLIHFGISEEGLDVIARLSVELAHRILDEIEGAENVLYKVDTSEPLLCPICGSHRWFYRGDRQVCADCGKQTEGE